LICEFLGSANVLGVLEYIRPDEARRVTVIASGRFPPSLVPEWGASVSIKTVPLGTVLNVDYATASLGLVDGIGSVVVCTASLGLVHHLGAVLDAASFGLAVWAKPV
jgi:hypothetical protein